MTNAENKKKQELNRKNKKNKELKIKLQGCELDNYIHYLGS